MSSNNKSSSSNPIIKIRTWGCCGALVALVAVGCGSDSTANSRPDATSQQANTLGATGGQERGAGSGSNSNDGNGSSGSQQNNGTDNMVQADSLVDNGDSAQGGNGVVDSAAEDLPPRVIALGPLENEDGHDLWLRYLPVTDAPRLAEYQAAMSTLVAPGTSAGLVAARRELERGLAGLLGAPLTSRAEVGASGGIVLGTPASSSIIAGLPLANELPALGDEGYIVRAVDIGGVSTLVVAGNTDTGALYGTFALLRHTQSYKSLTALNLSDSPKVEHRILNHWDNLDRSVERGYAGLSLWNWDQLPGTLSDTYTDYARANASIGINGTVLTNVNADAQVLTAQYLTKVQALANVFRPYGLQVYLTARFSAPIEIGNLATADPLNAQVRQWWADKAAEIYGLIPDFGGFLVKANSEGQPGPQDYGRNHADGANTLADAVAPYGGIVMWRAFVYSDAEPTDRIRQAYDEFQPLDGQFRANVLVQPKNGPLDFQPREPFHPLLGAMPQTPLALELQITKEYLGQDTHLSYLGPLFEEVLQADTFANGQGSTVAQVVDGSLHNYSNTAIAGVANIGNDRNWTGSHFNQANWYVYGRMAWDPNFSAASAAEEWIRQTLSNRPSVVETASAIMMMSHQAVVDYMTPLGLVHIMAEGHHYGPGPWVDNLGRADWNSVYYHRADATGLGFDRTATGSNAVEQYFDPVGQSFANRATVSDDHLLFFHHVGWNETLQSGRSLWDELVHRYTRGTEAVAEMNQRWSELQSEVDPQRHAEIASFLQIQQSEARWWRDAALSYFAGFSNQPIPEGYEQPLNDLNFYRQLPCPADRDRPRCEQIYGQ